ncbi:hypothetical protein ACFXPA_24585 [Amycolatopsis sp. NPDC059090]|uniref:hypothetical protein n=1 Tax=unclassified Amycolatopsis TaxID=2618356 RepID=UPI0036716D20
MTALWLDPTSGPGESDTLPSRAGAGVLALWTALGIGLGAAVSAFRLLTASDEVQPIWFAVAVPMFLPLLLGLVKLPRFRYRALAAALLLGAAAGTGVGFLMPAAAGTFWTTYLALSAGALIAAVVYGLIARPSTEDS